MDRSLGRERFLSLLKIPKAYSDYWNARRPPARHATINLECEPGETISVVVARSRMEAMRSLFAGKTDDEIVNIMIDELIQRYGLRVR